MAVRIRVELFRAVDDPVAVGEPHQQTVDERQRDVAQILDDSRFQIGAVRHELHEDLAVQLGECVRGLLQDRGHRGIACRLHRQLIPGLGPDNCGSVPA